MFYKFLFVSLLLHVTLSVTGQDNSEFFNKVGLQIGYGGIRVRDQVISRHLYTGSGVPIQVGYEYETEIYKMSASFLINTSDNSRLQTDILKGFSYKGDYGQSISDTVGSLDHRTIISDYRSFDFQMMWLVGNWKENKLKLFLGADYTFLAIDKQFLMLEYTNNINNRNHSVGILASVQFKPALKHTFSYSVWSPLVSIISRRLSLEYGPVMGEDFKRTTTFTNFRSFNNKITYNYRVARRWSVEASYLFNYYQVQFPRKDQILLQSVIAGVNFHF